MRPADSLSTKRKSRLPREVFVNTTLITLVLAGSASLTSRVREDSLSYSDGKSLGVILAFVAVLKDIFATCIRVCGFGAGGGNY